MLVLSRKIGERVYIGNDGSFVEIRRSAADRVTLAFNFPTEVKLLRGELHDRIVTGEKKPGTHNEQAHDAEWEQWARGQSPDTGEVL